MILPKRRVKTTAPHGGSHEAPNPVSVRSWPRDHDESLKSFSRCVNANRRRRSCAGFKTYWAKGFNLSISVQNAIVENAQVTGGEYLLLLILSRYAADDGTQIFPSIKTLAKDSRQHKRNVQRQLRSLEEKGLIVRAGMSCYSTISYRIAMEKLGGGAAPGGGNTPPVAKTTRGGGKSNKRGGAAPPDSSLDSSLNRQSAQIEKIKVNPKVKTQAGIEALSNIRNFLPSMKKRL